MSYTDNTYLNQVDDCFTRKDLMTVYIDAGYALGQADKVLEYEILTGRIKRVGRGKYEKISTKASQAKELHKAGYSYREIAECLKISKSQVGNYLNGQGGHDDGQTTA